MCLCVSVFGVRMGQRERQPSTIRRVGISLAKGQIGGKPSTGWGVRGLDGGLWAVSGFVDEQCVAICGMRWRAVHPRSHPQHPVCARGQWKGHAQTYIRHWDNTHGQREWVKRSLDGPVEGTGLNPLQHTPIHSVLQASNGAPTPHDPEAAT